MYTILHQPFPPGKSGLWLSVCRPAEVCTWVGYPTCRLLLSVCKPEEVCTQVCVQPCIILPVSYFHIITRNICQGGHAVCQVTEKLINILAVILAVAVQWVVVSVVIVSDIYPLSCVLVARPVPRVWTETNQLLSTALAW